MEWSRHHIDIRVKNGSDSQLRQAKLLQLPRKTRHWWDHSRVHAPTVWDNSVSNATSTKSNRCSGMQQTSPVAITDAQNSHAAEAEVRFTATTASWVLMMLSDLKWYVVLSTRIWNFSAYPLVVRYCFTLLDIDSQWSRHDHPFQRIGDQSTTGNAERYVCFRLFSASRLTRSQACLKYCTVVSPSTNWCTSAVSTSDWVSFCIALGPISLMRTSKIAYILPLNQLITGSTCKCLRSFKISMSYYR